MYNFDRECITEHYIGIECTFHMEFKAMNENGMACNFTNPKSKLINIISVNILCRETYGKWDKQKFASSIFPLYRTDIAERKYRPEFRLTPVKSRTKRLSSERNSVFPKPKLKNWTNWITIMPMLIYLCDLALEHWNMIKFEQSSLLLKMRNDCCRTDPCLMFDRMIDFSRLIWRENL